jgi:hypothetical protein
MAAKLVTEHDRKPATCIAAKPPPAIQSSRLKRNGAQNAPAMADISVLFMADLLGEHG